MEQLKQDYSEYIYFIKNFYLNKNDEDQQKSDSFNQRDQWESDKSDEVDDEEHQGNLIKFSPTRAQKHLFESILKNIINEDSFELKLSDLDNILTYLSKRKSSFVSNFRDESLDTLLDEIKEEEEDIVQSNTFDEQNNTSYQQQIPNLMSQIPPLLGPNLMTPFSHFMSTQPPPPSPSNPHFSQVQPPSLMSLMNQNNGQHQAPSLMSIQTSLLHHPAYHFNNMKRF